MGYEDCCLDVPFTHRRGSVAIDFRNRRRRVCQKIVQKHLLDQREKFEYDDGTRAVYRHRDGNFNAYVNCIFLDENDLILAGNERGTVNILRLPSYCEETDDTEEEGPPIDLRPCGKLLSSFSCVSHDAHDGMHFEHFKLHSLQRGNAFAVGDPFSGELRVYATERAKIRWKLQSPQPRSFAAPRPVVSTENSQSFDHHLICNIRGPMRRYYRCSFASLSFQIQNPTNYLLTRLEEIDEWEEEQAQRVEHCELDHKSNWDFRETSSGALLALHVGTESDLLGIRILDERSSKICVAVDLDMEKSGNETISNACFIDDKLLAYQCRSLDGCIKIWDIRMLNDSVQILPSFPKDTVFGFRTTPQISSVNTPSNRRQRGKHCPSRTKPLVIPDYSFTPLHCGNLIASTQRGDFHTVLDPYKRIIVQTVEINHPELTSFRNCFAVDQEFGTIAVYDESRKTIRLHSTSTCANQPDRGMGKKRSRSDDTSRNNNEIQATIYDDYHVNTSLSCLVYNERGTSLIGGSTDGDIFLWR